MRALSIDLRTLSPLAIRADHAETGAEMVGYIPGSSFVGALASIHRALYPQGQNFARFFLQDEVLFSNFYPANFDILHEALYLPVYPLPRTAISCKRYSGFHSEEHKDARKMHGVDDSLLDWALFRLAEERKQKPFLKALEEHKICPTCNESMDRFPGYYRRSKEPRYEREQAKSEHKRLQTRTGINRQTGTVEEGILYNRMVFEEDLHFWGQITLPGGELYDAFESFLLRISDEEISNESMLRLGTGRTRGLGKLATNFTEIYAEEDEEERFRKFQERLNKLNSYITHYIKEHAKYLVNEQDYFFAITLHSPLILCDELLRYQGKLDAETLDKEVSLYSQGATIPGLYPLYQNAGIKRVTGWNELWGTPKTNEYAIEAGSVFLFLCAGEPDEKLQRALFQLEERGLGKRRSEGFGRICISDDFHSEGRQ